MTTEQRRQAEEILQNLIKQYIGNEVCNDLDIVFPTNYKAIMNICFEYAQLSSPHIEITEEEIKYKLIAHSFNYEDEAGIVMSPCVKLDDAIKILFSLKHPDVKYNN